MPISGSLAVVTRAVLVSIPAIVTVATTNSDLLVPAATVPTFHTPVLLLNVVPPQALADTNVNPGGNTSESVTPVAGLKPAALLTVITNVTLLPTNGVGLSTVLVPTGRSAAG